MAKTQNLKGNGGKGDKNTKATDEKVIKSIFVFEADNVLTVTKTRNNKQIYHEIRIPTTYHSFLDQEEFIELISDIIQGKLPNHDYHGKIKEANAEAYNKLIHRCGFATEKFGFKKSPAKKKEKVPYKRERISLRRMPVD